MRNLEITSFPSGLRTYGITDRKVSEPNVLHDVCNRGGGNLHPHINSLLVCPSYYVYLSLVYPLLCVAWHEYGRLHFCRAVHIEIVLLKADPIRYLPSCLQRDVDCRPVDCQGKIFRVAACNCQNFFCRRNPNRPAGQRTPCNRQHENKDDSCHEDKRELIDFLCLTFQTKTKTPFQKIHLEINCSFKEL